MATKATERKRGRQGQQDRLRILKRDNGLCLHCLAQGKATIADEVDHIIPLHQGGSDEDDNKQSLCHSCHAIKTAQDSGNKYKSQVSEDGLPLDPCHHWNR